MNSSMFTNIAMLSRKSTYSLYMYSNEGVMIINFQKTGSAKHILAVSVIKEGTVMLLNMI